MEFLTVLLCLLAVHWVCDYPLQGDFLATAKVKGPLPTYHLIAHAGIHAGGVYLVTSSLTLAVAEWVLHSVIDWMKGQNGISFARDQYYHISCKVLWASVFITL